MDLVAAVQRRYVSLFPGPPEEDLLELDLFHGTNSFRQWRGARPLGLHTDLCQRAKTHARAMAQGAAPFSHVGAMDRFAGGPYTSFAENLARAEGVEKLAVATVDGWIASPGHCRNLLGPFNAVGIGVAFRPAPDGGPPIVFVSQLLADVPGGADPGLPQRRWMQWPSLTARPVASAAWVGYLAAGGFGALGAAGAVAALELGKGFRVVTAPRVVKRLVLEKAGLGVERCSACGRSAPELLCRDPRVNGVMCSASATQDFV